MTNENINQPEFQEEEESINIYEIIFKYLAYWPWFVISVIVCLVAAFVYLRFAAPVYNVSAAVLVKEDDPKSQAMKGMNGAMSVLQDMGSFSVASSFDNEVEILHSRTLIQKVVTDHRLYITHYQDRATGYDPMLYKTSPVEVFMSPEEASNLDAGVTVNMDFTTEGKLSVVAKYFQKNGAKLKEKEEKQSFEQLPAVMTTPVGTITFSQSVDSLQMEEDMSLKATIISPVSAAIAFAGNLSVTPTSKTTTIAQISLQTENTELGEDFINLLVGQYNSDANDEKNQVALRTAEFIEERIRIINKELGSTETKLANFKQRSGLTDLKTNAQIALEENTAYEKQRLENATQISLVGFLKNYINDPANAGEVVPANVGLKDNGLTEVISQYNLMVIEMKNLLRTSSENNPAVINLKTSISAMEGSLRTSVESVLKGLLIAKADLDRKARSIETRISDAPAQEKEFMTISRQQEIKAQLYTLLLQKREENAITLAATANNGRIIERPLAGNAPISPKKPIIMLAGLILGLALPVGFVFLRDLLKYKIETRADVEKITDVTILAELPATKTQTGKGAIVVRENHNNLMEETFRGLRTNLLFMLNKGQKVILVSSTQPGEGKSFVAGNLAASLAYLGKKTVIVGMDIRKPGLNKVFNLSRRVEGITNFLSDPDNVNLFDMVQASDFSPNLDILPGGPIPPNPTELVTRNVLEIAIEKLKERYDYIILDTAPIAMVPDTAIIGRVADACVYVCRADETPKAGYEYINVLKRERRFPVLATVINGIDMSKRRHSYGYGYGKKYGYGKGYGYGYGYGFDETNKKK